MTEKMNLPYFPFYVNDWLSSPTVMMMDIAQEGAYLRLMAICWAGDGLPDDDDSMMELSRLKSLWLRYKDGLDYHDQWFDYLENTTAMFRAVFTEKRNGRLWNKRLLEERIKAEKAYNSRVSGGKNRHVLANPSGKAEANPSGKASGNQNQIQNQNTESEALKAVKEKNITKKETEAEAIYNLYAEKIRPGAPTSARKNIQTLLKKLPGTKLVDCINNYAISHLLNPIEQYRYQANNFFGKAAHYVDFLEPVRPPENAINKELDDLPWLSPYWNPKGLSKGDWSAAVEAYAKSKSLNPYRLTKDQKKEAAEHVRLLNV